MQDDELERLAQRVADLVVERLLKALAAVSGKTQSNTNPDNHLQPATCAIEPHRVKPSAAVLAEVRARRAKRGR